MGTASSVSITMLGFLAPCLLLLAALAEGRPQEEWATYKAIYGKEYSGAEDLMRYSRWLKNKEVVDAHNSGDHSYKMALMEHSDWTEEEVNEMRLASFLPNTTPKWSSRLSRASPPPPPSTTGTTVWLLGPWREPGKRSMEV